MNYSATLPTDEHRVVFLTSAVVTPLPGRCVQCGICSWNCPVGIDVRSYARDSEPVLDPRCLRCGTCVARCPRGTLQLLPFPSAA